MSKVKLTDVCEITTGKLDSNAFDEKGLYPFFTCSPDPLRINTYAFDGDVILLAGNNASGNFHCNRYNGKFNAYQRTYVITAKNGYDIDYIFYNLKINLAHLKKIAQGSQTKFLTMKILDNFMLEDIPLIEQKKLSSILRFIDSKISKNNRINAELESMAKTIYDYWFTQFDFPDENGKPYKSSGGKMVWNEELKREIPDGWEVGKLSDLCELINGRAYSQNELQDSGKYRILRVGNFFTNNSWYYSDMELEEDKYAIAGDLLYCWSASFGPSIWNYEKVIYHYHIWKVKCPEYNKLYVYELMKELTSQFVKSTHGSIMLHLTKDGMEKQTVLIPEHTVLQQFSNALSPIFEKKRINENENQQLASLRDWLLPMLMNGQVGFEGVE